MDYTTANVDLSNVSYLSSHSNDEENETQYFSVLEDNLEFDGTIVEEKVLNSEELSDPVIFTINGSNQIYSVQSAQDEEGNIHKYQVEYKEANGELVPMLDTIRILSLEDVKEQSNTVNQDDKCSNMILETAALSHEISTETEHEFDNSEEVKVDQKVELKMEDLSNIYDIVDRVTMQHVNDVQIQSESVLKDTNLPNVDNNAPKSETALEKVIYVQMPPEKENVEMGEVQKFHKPNLRSLLKCNQPQADLKTLSESQRITKRNFRSKEAIQEKMFKNFLDSTTIPQAPERKERLPRKQQIKPVQHPNEDIVVQPMLVSSKGFIEPITPEITKLLPVTEYVELDSDDDSTKGESNLVQIEIIDSDDEGSDPITKKRGRTSKNKESEVTNSDSNLVVPPKISRTAEEKLAKTSLASKTSATKIPKIEKKHFDYKHECGKCKSTFINKFLLNRHKCVSKLRQPAVALNTKSINTIKTEIPLPKTSSGAISKKLSVSTNRNVLKSPCRTLVVNRKCALCPTTFNTNEEWLTHQIEKHNMKTPVKSVGDKQSTNVLSREAHVGITPVRNKEMSQNIRSLREKIQQLQ